MSSCRQAYRGLDYYNKTVFEFSSVGALGAQNVFCGGGRYALGGDVGAKENFQCVGVGIGFNRLLMLLEEKAGTPGFTPLTHPLHVIIPLCESAVCLSLLLSQQ